MGGAEIPLTGWWDVASGATPTPTATSRWLTAHLRRQSDGSPSSLEIALQKAVQRRMKISARTQQVDDHLQQFYAKVLRRDAFAPHLAGGATLTYGRVAAWCVNSARTDARDSGTEPVSRALHYARSEQERRAGTEPEPPASLADVSDMPAPPAADFDLLWTKTCKKILSLLPDRIPAQTLSLLTAHYRDSETISDAALREGIPRARAAAQIAKVRRVLKQQLRKRGINSVAEYFSC